MDDQELLELYRLKRSCDGFNGRVWDASWHLKLDELIEKEEVRRKDIPQIPVDHLTIISEVP